MPLRNRAGIITANILRSLFGADLDKRIDVAKSLGRVWMTGPGRKSNHGYRKSALYHAMKGVDYTMMQPTYLREPTPNQWTKWKGIRPARSYRGLRRNDAWARKDVGNTKPAERRQLLEQGVR